MAESALRILAFEPFDAGSHRAVRESLARLSRHEWTWLTKPGRSWKWRMRTGALEMLDEAAAGGLLDAEYDVIFATSLLGAADLRACLPPRLRNTPLVLYMHENQAAYPTRQENAVEAERDVHFALTNLTSVIAADLTIWNSRWNQHSFITGIDDIIRHAPDLSSGAALRSRIEERSEICWPPVEPPPAEIEAAAEAKASAETTAAEAAADPVLHNPIRVVWPHRWEHDKGPDELLRLAERYSERLNLQFIILGEEFGRTPPAMGEFRTTFASRILHIGYEPDRAEYWRWLSRADWVLSTARHEFFGLAVAEALLAGCLPWLPDRLSYPELLPPIARGISPLSPPRHPDAVRRLVREHLEPALAPTAVRRIDDAIARAGARKPTATYTEMKPAPARREESRR